MRCNGMGADREFTNIRVVASKKKGLRVNRERSFWKEAGEIPEERWIYKPREDLNNQSSLRKATGKVKAYRAVPRAKCLRILRFCLSSAPSSKDRSSSCSLIQLPFSISAQYLPLDAFSSRSHSTLKETGRTQRQLRS